MLKRILPQDWQDAQRLLLGSVGAFLFVYQIMGYDLDVLLNRVQRAGSGALIVWAVFVKEPPRSREDNDA